MPSLRARRATRFLLRSCWPPAAATSCQRRWRRSSSRAWPRCPTTPTSWCASRRSPVAASVTTCWAPSAAASPAELASGLREATAHNVLVADAAGGYAFRHALLQEAAYAQLLPGERVALHGAYAAALAASPQWAPSTVGASAELAYHYAAARDPARALGAAVAAARAAADSYALGEAHALYEHALALWDQVPDPAALAGCEHVALLERCADAATLAGQTKRAIALVRSALGDVDAASDPARAALLHWRLARLLWNSSDGTGALSAHHQAVALMPTAPSPERAMILAADAHVLVLSARYQQSQARCEEAIQVARAAGALREEGYALNTLGGALCRLGQSDAAVDCLQQALQIAETVGSVDDLRRGYSNLAVVLEEIGRLARAVEVGRAGIERLDALGYEAGKGNVRCTTASALRSAGAWQDADLLAAQALQDPTSDHVLWMGREVRGSIAARRGDFTAAHAFLKTQRRGLVDRIRRLPRRSGRRAHRAGLGRRSTRARTRTDRRRAAGVHRKRRTTPPPTPDRTRAARRRRRRMAHINTRQGRPTARPRTDRVLPRDAQRPGRPRDRADRPKHRATRALRSGVRARRAPPRPRAVAAGSRRLGAASSSPTNSPTPAGAKPRRSSEATTATAPPSTCATPRRSPPPSAPPRYSPTSKRSRGAPASACTPPPTPPTTRPTRRSSASATANYKSSRSSPPATPTARSPPSSTSPTKPPACTSHESSPNSASQTAGKPQHSPTASRYSTTPRLRDARSVPARRRPPRHPADAPSPRSPHSAAQQQRPGRREHDR